MEIQLHCDIKILSCTNESWDLLSSSPRGSILTNAMIGHTSFIRWAIPVYVCLKIVYRITTILKVETDIIANISANLIGRTGIFVIMSVEAFKTDIIVFIGDVIMCFTSDWQINLGMQVTTDLVFLWIKVISVIQTLSAAHIKGKMSNLSITFFIDHTC